MKSKSGKVIRQTNQELEEDCKLAKQQVCKLEYQLSEQNVLLEELQIKNRALSMDSENYNQGIEKAFNQISGYLSSRASVEDLTRAVMEEDALLKAKINDLESKVVHLESQLCSTEERISSFSNIQKKFEDYKSRANSCKEHVADLSVQFETQLNNLIRAREVALKESIACGPNDTLVRKNKSLEEEVEKFANENMDLRAEINELKFEKEAKDKKIEMLQKEVIV